LLNVRAKRVKPRLDDEDSDSMEWLNAKGYVDAYRAFDEPVFLNKAKKTLLFLSTKLSLKSNEVI
jgi:uncharacterized protein YyaL (SSP411 family)